MKKLDVGDVLVVVGLGLLLWGLWLFDYRLAIVGGVGFSSS